MAAQERGGAATPQRRGASKELLIHAVASVPDRGMKSAVCGGRGGEREMGREGERGGELEICLAVDYRTRRLTLN